MGAPTEEEFLKMYSAVHANPPQLELPKRPSETELLQQVVDLEQRLIKAEAQLEALKLMASYAQDVVDYWPNMTMRTIRVMIPKMDALKEALNLVK